MSSSFFKGNKWNLILGVLFLGYGIYRLQFLIQQVEKDNFGITLAVGFIVVGIYDIYKFYRNEQQNLKK